jgi:2-iminoacetate synthase ThiH
MATKNNNVVVIEETVEHTDTDKKVFLVTATSSSGIVSTRKAPAGYKEAGDIFAVEVTRVKVPEWRIQNYWPTKAKALAAAKASVGANKTGGDVLKAKVVEAKVVEAAPAAAAEAAAA